MSQGQARPSPLSPQRDERERDLAKERFEAMKRQSPMLYGVILVNLIGVHLTTVPAATWSLAIALPVVTLMAFRVVYWQKQRPSSAARIDFDTELKKSYYFTLAFALVFSIWSLYSLVTGTPDQQKYVVVFASLAAVASATAMISFPRAAVIPLLLIGLPVALWLITAGSLSYAVVGISLAAAVALICRMLQQQDKALIAMVASRAAARSHEERFRLVSQATTDVIWDLDIASGALDWSDAIYAALNYRKEDVEPTLDWWVARIHPEDRDEVREHFETTVHGEEACFSSHYRFARGDGTYADIFDRGYIVRDLQGRPIRGVGTMQDISAQKRNEDLIRWSATHDSLTKLPNRLRFQEQLSLALQDAERRNLQVGVLQLDLDRFKDINDTFGHDAGDAVLIAIADRLSSKLRVGDMVARLGGDEFAVVLVGINDHLSVLKIAQSLLEGMRKPVIHDGHLIDCRTSIGASVFPVHGTRPAELLKKADLALYAAKKQGRGRLCVYQPNLSDESRRRSAMLKQARSAVDDDCIAPYYQPKIDLRTARIVGFEALLRWRGVDGGCNFPADIAAAFDDFELAREISQRMVEKVCIDLRHWLHNGIDFGHVAINAGTAEFRSPGFARKLLATLGDAGVPAKCVQIEITEKVFLGRGADYVHDALNDLKKAGISVALDDFGTGYAALSHLKDFPVDALKIDQSFVRDLGQKRDRAIVAAILKLAQTLGISSTGEGVETVEQAETLIRMGCGFAQGFLFSEAVPAGALPAMLDIQSSKTRMRWQAFAT